MLGKFYWLHFNHVVLSIYLIFDFGKRKHKKRFENKLNKSIPDEYKNNIFAVFQRLQYSEEGQ